MLKCRCGERSGVLLAASLAWGALASIASAQCEPQWLYSPAQSFPGVDIQIHAMAEGDPDGPGSEGPGLVVGGLFTIAGDALCSNIAVWREGSWESLGTENPGLIESLLIRDDGLYVGGLLSTVKGVKLNHIARWDGTDWLTVGDGLSSVVFAMHEWNGQLVAGGEFTKTGSGKEAHGVARWDGSTWSSMGWGVDGTVYALAEYKGDLYAAGQFIGADFKTVNNVARWDGAAWQRLGPVVNAGVSGLVSALAVYEDELIIGGNFEAANGKPVSRLARWNGQTMSAFPGAFERMTKDAGEPRVLALRTWDEALYVGGRFGSIQEIATGNLARWKDGAWSAVGGAWVQQEVRAIGVEPSGERLVFNARTIKPGEVITSNVVGFDGLGWKSYGEGRSYSIFQAHVYKDVLIAHSAFPEFPGMPGLAQWDGRAWTPLADAPMSSGYAFTEFEGELIVGGGFLESKKEFGNVGAWDGRRWKPMGGGLPSSGWKPVWDLHVHNGELIAGGAFTISGGAPADSIAKWNGSAWVPLAGGGLTGGAGVQIMETFGPDLFVAGDFTKAGNQPVTNIARWTGTKWSEVFHAVNGMAISEFNAFEVWDNKLLLACRVNLPAPTPYIVVWNAPIWSVMTQGDANGHFGPLAVYNDELYCGTQNLKINGLPMTGIMRWDGQAWANLGSGLANSIGKVSPANTLAVYRGELVVGGEFKVAGGQVSAHWARWGCEKPTCYPDCDQSGGLNIDDFVCFQTLYAVGDPQADCDASGSLDIDDFVCFQTGYAVGC